MPIRGGIDRNIKVPDFLLRRIHTHAKITEVPSGRKVQESANRVIERALDFEDMVRAGIFGASSTCYLDATPCRDLDVLIAHVRQAHPGVIRGAWKK